MSLDTKSRIKQAALGLFVDKGVAETTIRDLAASAGIAEGTLYRHYASKEDLVRDLFQEHFAGFARRIDRLQRDASGLRAKIRAIVFDSCRMFDEDPTLYRFLLLVQHEALPRLPKGGDSPVSILRAIISQAIERGETALSDPGIGAAFVLGLLVQPAILIVHGTLDPPLGRYAGDIADACERALLAR